MCIILLTVTVYLQRDRASISICCTIFNPDSRNKLRQEQQFLAFNDIFRVLAGTSKTCSEQKYLSVKITSESFNSDVWQAFIKALFLFCRGKIAPSYRDGADVYHNVCRMICKLSYCDGNSSNNR